MPQKVYEVTHPTTGRTIEMEGDRPPTEDEIKSAFASLPPAESPVASHAQPDPKRAALDAAAAKEAKKPGQFVNALPAIGGAVGGILGGTGGTAFGLGFGGVPGAVGGATVGGMGGEALKQNLNRVMGNPAPPTTGEAASDIATEGVVQGVAELTGAGLTRGAAAVAPRLMQSALKPAYSAVARETRRAEVPRVVQTLLDQGINVTPGGIGQINTLLDATNADIRAIIANSTDVVYPENVVSAADAVLNRVSNQVAPMTDRTAAAGVVDEFARVHGGAPNYPMRPMSVQRAQELKQGTYSAIGDRAYGETRGAALEAEKALARGLKEGIEAAHPQVRDMNRLEGDLIKAREVIARRVATAANRDMAGIGWITSNPKTFIAFLLDRSPAVKSMLARGLYQSAARATHVPENLIRLGVQALATSGDMQPVASHEQGAQ